MKTLLFIINIIYIMLVITLVNEGIQLDPLTVTILALIGITLAFVTYHLAINLKYNSQIEDAIKRAEYNNKRQEGNDWDIDNNPGIPIQNINDLKKFMYSNAEDVDFEEI